MALEFKLPELGEGVTSADVASLLVAEGETVSAGQNVVELETDKAVVELPIPHAGIVTKILAKLGMTIKPGDPIMLIETAGSSTPSAPATPASPAPASKPASPPAAAPPSAAPPAAPATAASSGPVDILLPELGEGVNFADIAGILVNEGDTIAVGQNLMELETDKAVVELPSTHAGTIQKIHIKSGQTVKVGEKLLTIAATSAATAPAASPTPPAAPASSPAPAPAKTASAPVAPAAPASRATAPTAASSSSKGPAPAGPATRRLARELGVDLHLVSGSGPGGRITIEDLQEFVRKIMTGETKSPNAAAAPTGPVAPPLPDFTQFGEVERKAMNKIAKTAANNLSFAWQTIPHVTQHDLADVTELEAGRKRASQNKTGTKITMTVLAIKAVVAALKQYPQFNSSIDTATNEIIHKNYYHVGVAVDTEQGLVVPVIRDVNHKSVMEIAQELETLAAKARERKLTPADFQGGTFTISNLGGIGGTSFTPIVNWPEVAILGMSRSRQQLMIVNGEPQPRLMLPLSLSYDHRVINGADAARFIVKISGLLADPSQLLIES